MLESVEYPTVVREETCSVSAVRRIAAMLDLAPDEVHSGQDLPLGWHFILLAADSRRAELRSDGFPGLGVPMPDLGLPRLMIGGRSVQYLRPIQVGADVRRISRVASIIPRKTPTGDMALVTVSHELSDALERPAVVETQTYVLMGQQGASRAAREAVSSESPAATKTVTPDETLLFQYSALGFNSHKIHIDRAHARDIEGYPDLVVNGGLTALLLTEFARRELGLRLKSMRMKNLSPLFCGRPMTLTASQESGGWILAAHSEAGVLGARMDVETL